MPWMDNVSIRSLTLRSITMFAMFKQLFNAFTVLFMAVEKGASAINHLTTWSEETAASFADEARVQRQAKMNAMMREQKVTDKQLSVAASK
jgi:hypothetical protein